MASVMDHVANLVIRQADLNPATPGCSADNDYNGEIGARISAIFVILVGSTLGAVFPVFAKKHAGAKVPEWAFFIAKYFGSGVIIATAFIHLLAPANHALTDPCLTGPITEYDWVEGIALMTVFVLFFVEIMAMRYATFGQSDPHDEIALEDFRAKDGTKIALKGDLESNRRGSAHSHAPGEDHLSHARTHEGGDPYDQATYDDKSPNAPPVHSLVEDYAARLTALFILEFGVVFHSIFVGLTLAVSGAEFHTLYVVLVFHQTFEGLGLGTRLASVPWPKSKQWTPYLLGLAYGFSTPIALAVGLGIRKTYAPGTQKALIVNGVFNSISAGILIYTGLVELMAHEFMFSEGMRKAKVGTVLSAFGVMCLGAALMALLGKWA